MFKILLNPQKAEKHPFEIFLIGLIYSSISILFSLWVFPEYSSIAFVFLTTFSCLYLIQSAIKIEEEKETTFKKEVWILKEHSKLLTLFIFLFLGFTISFTIWAFALPAEQISTLFDFQDLTVEGIKASVGTGSFASASTFFAILINNIKVMIISIIFALFFGAGAIYVLVWNASVMGFVIGELARKTFGLISLPIAFTKYFIHGIPEMIAYFIAALAGGIIYVAIWKGDFKEKIKRKKIITDALILVVISLALLILSGLIEVFISPYI